MRPLFYLAKSIMQVSLFPPLMFSLFPFFVVLPTMCPRTLRFLRSTPLLFWSTKTPCSPTGFQTKKRAPISEGRIARKKAVSRCISRCFFFAGKFAEGFRGQICRGLDRPQTNVRPWAHLSLAFLMDLVFKLPPPLQPGPNLLVTK